MYAIASAPANNTTTHVIATTLRHVLFVPPLMCTQPEPPLQNPRPRHESHVSTWLRRAVTIPAVTLAWALAVLTAPLTFPLAALADVLSNWKFPFVRTLAMLLVYLTAEVIGIGRSFTTWLRWKTGHRDHATFLEDTYRLQHWWAMTLYRWAARLYSLRIEIDESRLGEPRQSIVFVRHVCIFDNLVPYLTLTHNHGIRMRWAINSYLLRDPCLDIAGHRLPNTFVRNDRTDGAAQAARVTGLLDGLGAREGVQLFPEGALFHPARRERALARLREGGKHLLYERARQLRGTLPPRLGGALGLLENNPGADAVFISHTGLEAAGSYRAILRGGLVGQHLRIRAWRIPYDDIPRGHDALASWFLDQWEEIDRFVQEQVETPAAAPEPVTTG